MADDAPDRSAALPYYNRANRYIKQERYDDALRDLEQAIKLFPDEPDFHTNLGIVYRKLNRYADAEREFKIAIAYNRDDWMNWSNLANAYLKQDMLEKTVATFEETLKHKPPEVEQAAIRKDIADIKKILAMKHDGSPEHELDKGGASGKAARIAEKSSRIPPAKKTLPPQGVTTVNTGNEIPISKSKVSRGTNTGVKVSPAHISGAEKNADWGYDAK